MDKLEQLFQEALKCNLSEGRRALIRLKKLANEIQNERSILLTKIDAIETPKTVEITSTIGDKTMKKVVTKPVKTQAKQ